MSGAYHLFAGHKDYNVMTYRGIGSIDHLKKVFEASIVGWLPHANNHPSSAWGQIRSIEDGKLVATAVWNKNKWDWV